MIEPEGGLQSTVRFVCHDVSVTFPSNRNLRGAGDIGASSGHPFHPTVGFDNARLRPSSNEQGPARWFDPAAYRLPAAGFLGTLGRNVLTGPGLFALDAALRKDLWRTDRHTVTLRAEAYNLTNRPNFLTPATADLALFDSTGAALPTAGRLTSTSTPSRQLQMSLRWAF